MRHAGVSTAEVEMHSSRGARDIPENVERGISQTGEDGHDASQGSGGPAHPASEGEAYPGGRKEKAEKTSRNEDPSRNAEVRPGGIDSSSVGNPLDNPSKQRSYQYSPGKSLTGFHPHWNKLAQNDWQAEALTNAYLRPKGDFVNDGPGRHAALRTAPVARSSSAGLTGQTALATVLVIVGGCTV